MAKTKVNNQPNVPIDMGPFLGEGGVVPDIPLADRLTFYPGQHAGEPDTVPTKRKGTVPAAPVVAQAPMTAPTVPTADDRAHIVPVVADPSTPTGNLNSRDPSVPEVIPGLDLEKAGLSSEKIGPSPTQAYWDQVGLNHEAGLLGTTKNPGSFVQWAVEKSLGLQEQDPKVPVDEARRRWPGVEFTFDVDPKIGQYRFDVAQRQRTVQMFLQNSHNEPGGFGTGLMAMATSPAELLAGIGAGKIAGAGLRAAGVLSEASAITELAAPRWVLNAGGRLVENLTGNAVYQGSNAALRIQQGKEVNANAELSSGVLNALFFAAFDSAVVRPAGKYLEKRFPDALKMRRLRELFVRSELGLPAGAPAVDAAGIKRALGANADGSVNPYSIDFTGHPSERSYYQALNGDTGENVDFTGRGVGITSIDHQDIATSATGNPEGPIEGSVTEGLHNKETKFLNLDEKLSNTENMKIAREIESQLGVDLKLSPDLTLQEAIDRIPHDHQLAASEVVNEAGYGGYKETVKVGNEPHHTAVTLFDSEQFKASDGAPERSKSVAPVSQDAMNLDASDPKAQAGYDEKLTKKAEAAVEATPKTDEQRLSQAQDAEKLADSALADSEDSELIQDELEKIDLEDKVATKNRELLTTFFNCVLNGML